MLTTADPAALTAAFAKEADDLARQIVVTAKVPAGFDEHQLERARDGPDHRRDASPPRRTCRCGAPQDIAAEKAAARGPAAGERRPARPLRQRDVRRLSAPSASGCSA